MPQNRRDIKAYKKRVRSTFIGFGVLGTVGLLSAVAPVVVSLIWLGVFLYSFYALSRNNQEVIWYFIAASPALEVWARMSKAPGLPSEVGKYYLLFAIILFLLSVSNRKVLIPFHRVGWTIIILLLPSLAVALPEYNKDNWIFNISGVLELAILAIFAGYEKWDTEKYTKMLQYALMPLISIAVFLTIKTPSFDEIDFQLGANFETTGGFGSNQVSTILGLGIVLTSILLVMKRPLFGLTFANYALLLIFLFRGFLSFSRGGMLVAGISVILLFLPNIFSSLRNFTRFFIFGILISGILFGVFFLVNNITNNELLLRYQGETYETEGGDKEKTINVITTGRSNIALSDLQIFYDNPVFGVGPGMAKMQREKYGFINTAAHVEYTRLLSENGIGGLFVTIVLSVFPFVWVFKQKNKMLRGVLGALFAVSILNTFHAATRTNVTPVFFALACISVYVIQPPKRQNEVAV